MRIFSVAVTEAHSTAADRAGLVARLRATLGGSGEAQSQPLRHLSQRFDCLAVTLFGESQQMLKTDRLFDDSGTASAACRTCLRVVTNRRGVGRIHFPAAAIAATALEPILDEGGVSELARGTGRTLHQLVVEYQSAADAFGDCDDHQIAQAFGAAAEADL